MIRYRSHKQLSLEEFDWPFQTALDKDNRWIKLSDYTAWHELAEGYYQGLSDTRGRPTKDVRLVIGAVIIKHKLCLSDRETVAHIRRIRNCSTSWVCLAIRWPQEYKRLQLFFCSLRMRYP
jgi:hypothetical protein